MTLTQWLAHGFADASLPFIVLYTLIVTHITIVSVTVYLHRYSAHRALTLHPVLAHFFRLWLWLTTGMLTKEWTAIHRKHHATCETEDDPHSPQVMGLGKIFWQGVEVYRAAAVPETLDRYGAGCPDDWLERNVYTGLTGLGIYLMLGINLMLFGAIGLTVWAIQMMWIPVLAAGVINGVGHYWGYRNFECAAAARNIVPWGILIGGEELHNNHHTYPNSAKLSAKWWEFDIGWLWIRLFETVGLASVRSKGPVASTVTGKSSLDTETAWAIVNDRFRVMSRYAERVLKPAVKAEQSGADAMTKKILKRARRPLVRHAAVVTPQNERDLAAALAASPHIRQLYELKERLQEVWASRANADELLEQLVAWCKAAEESGVQALRDFADELKSYSVPATA